MDQTPPTFFRITVGLYALLTVFGAAIALRVVSESKSISSAGGWVTSWPLRVVIFLLRHLVDDFDPSQARWAVGLQSVLGMWWGITVLVPLALAVQVLAYATHRVLRRILTTT